MALPWSSVFWYTIPIISPNHPEILTPILSRSGYPVVAIQNLFQDPRIDVWPTTYPSLSWIPIFKYGIPVCKFTYPIFVYPCLSICLLVISCPNRPLTLSSSPIDYLPRKFIFFRVPWYAGLPFSRHSSRSSNHIRVGASLYYPTT